MAEPKKELRIKLLLISKDTKPIPVPLYGSGNLGEFSMKEGVYFVYGDNTVHLPGFESGDKEAFNANALKKLYNISDTELIGFDDCDVCRSLSSVALSNSSMRIKEDVEQYARFFYMIKTMIPDLKKVSK